MKVPPKWVMAVTHRLMQPPREGLGYTVRLRASKAFLTLSRPLWRDGVWVKRGNGFR